MCANCKTCTYSFPKQNATSLWNRFLHRGLSNPNRNLWRYLNPVSCSIHDVTVCGLCFDAQQIKSQPWPMVLVKWRLPGLPGLLRLPVYSRLDSSAVVSYQSCDCVVGEKKPGRCDHLLIQAINWIMNWINRSKGKASAKTLASTSTVDMNPTHSHYEDLSSCLAESNKLGTLKKETKKFVKRKRPFTVSNFDLFCSIQKGLNKKIILHL